MTKQPRPKRRRLLHWMRDKLKRQADEIIVPRAEKAALDAAYKAAEPLVRKAVAAKFPPRDMKICQKYNAAYIDDCIKMQFPDGGVDVFSFAEDTGPVVAAKTYQGQIYLADAETAAAVATWLAAKEAFDGEYKKRRAAYRALIDGANYLDDVASVWPDAAEVIPLNSLPIPLGPEQIALVQADVSERAA